MMMGFLSFVATVLVVALIIQPVECVSHSSIAFPGKDGKLEYTLDDDDNRIPDFSNAGYRGGGVKLPNVRVVSRIRPINGDNTDHLQAAIRAVERLPSLQGFRGALLLAAGEYNISGSLTIQASGVVLRGMGSGMDPTRHSILRRTGNSTLDVIQVGIGENHGFSNPVENTRRNITTDRVLVGDRSFHVDDAGGFNVGDNINVIHPCTHTWLEAVDFGGTAGDDPWAEDSQPLIFSRTITAINDRHIFINAPIFNTLDRSLSQSYIVLADRQNVLENVGIEHVRVSISTKGRLSEEHARSAIVYTETDNCWIQNVVTEHFILSGFLLRTSTRCTVLDSFAIDPHSRVYSSRRYNFNVDQSQLILFENCHATNARHAFVGNGGSRDNGIVFLNATSSRSYGPSEPHRRWAMGFLYDGLREINIRSSGRMVMGLYNRGSWGTGHGWAGVHSIAWNCNIGTGTYIIEKPPTAQNYAIGCRGTISDTSPFNQATGFIELTEVTDLEPVSLYRKQLVDRKSMTIKSLLGNPKNFVSLGSITATSDALNFDTDTLIVSGGLNGMGQIIISPDGNEVVVFAFSFFDLYSSPTVSGRRPLAIVSQSDLIINANLDLNGRSETVSGKYGSAGPGGFDGGETLRKKNKPDHSEYSGYDGKGPGGSEGSPSKPQLSGGGAGYGGQGGRGEMSGGNVAGDRQMSELIGGSGAGATIAGGGGGGGGALALVASGNILVGHDAVITANGGAGASKKKKTSGGGSGGGILMIGRNVIVNGTVQANGGNGDDAEKKQANGGGGGGGRVAVYYEEEVVINGNVETLGGIPVGSSVIGQPGAKGTIYYSGI